MNTFRVGRKSSLDVIALEILLDEIEHRGLMDGTRFGSEFMRARKRLSGPTAKFTTLYRLLVGIDSAGLLLGTELEARWHRVRSMHDGTVPRLAPPEHDGLRPLPTLRRLARDADLRRMRASA